MNVIACMCEYVICLNDISMCVFFICGVEHLQAQSIIVYMSAINWVARVESKFCAQPQSRTESGPCQSNIIEANLHHRLGGCVATQTHTNTHISTVCVVALSIHSVNCGPTLGVATRTGCVISCDRGPEPRASRRKFFFIRIGGHV